MVKLKFNKFILLILVLTFTLICSASSGETDKNIYSNPENWAYFSQGNASVDLFLICPAVDTKDENNMSLSDDETKRNFLGALNMERGIYEKFTRIYAPYYRQMALKVYNLSDAERKPYFEIAYSDVSSAFSYYLEHENNGRPIILAGFSQGSEMCYELLKEYFGDEKLYSRLIAVYAIGWPCDEENAKKYPWIKPAQSENDLGTVISFECEAPEITSTRIFPENKRAFVINPLNWETDETFADKNLNSGACFTDYEGRINNEIQNFCGCYIDLKRSVLKIPDIVSSDYPAVISFLPDGAYHVYDYMFFFRNLQNNVEVRINKFFTNSKGS